VRSEKHRPTDPGATSVSTTCGTPLARAMRRYTSVLGRAGRSHERADIEQPWLRLDSAPFHGDAQAIETQARRAVEVLGGRRQIRLAGRVVAHHKKPSGIARLFRASGGIWSCYP
jgi:hypothetical protein